MLTFTHLSQPSPPSWEQISWCRTLYLPIPPPEFIWNTFIWKAFLHFLRPTRPLPSSQLSPGEENLSADWLALQSIPWVKLSMVKVSAGPVWHLCESRKGTFLALEELGTNWVQWLASWPRSHTIALYNGSVLGTNATLWPLIAPLVSALPSISDVILIEHPQNPVRTCLRVPDISSVLSCVHPRVQAATDSHRNPDNNFYPAGISTPSH